MKSLIKRKNNKEYKSNKSIILLSIIFALILVAATVIAYYMFGLNSNSISDNNSPDSIQRDLSEITLSDTDSSDTEEVSFYTSYKPYKAIESETTKEISLATVFGSAYSQYGGELKLNEDNTFSLYVGISNSDDSKGTFNLEDNKIKATFNNGEEKEFLISNENGATVIMVPMGLYNIYFKP